MMEFIHEPFEHPFEHPFHHHHHEVNPIELAQIGGASQYAKLSYRLQKHIEDDTRHITDEERYKWNKTYNDLKALKEDIEDGTISGGDDKTKLSEFINDVPFVSESSLTNRLGLYATEDWVTMMLKNINNVDLSKYISKDDIIGTINGKSFKYGSNIEISGSGDGLSWTDIQNGIYWDGSYGASTSTYKLGDIFIGGMKTPVYAKEGTGGGTSASVSYTAEQSVINDSTRYTLGTLTVGSQNYPIYGKDNVGTGGGSGESVLRWTDIVYTKNDSNTEAPAAPYEENGQFIYHDINNTVTWYDHAPNASRGEYIWVCWVTYRMEGDVQKCINIEGPKCISGEDGDPGADSPATEFVYRRANDEQSVQGRWGLDSTTGHIGNNTAVVSNTGQDDFVPDQWNDNPSGVSEAYPYEWMAFRVSKVVNGKRSWDGVTFNGPYLWSRWGQRGTDGDGIEYIFSDPVDPANYSQNTMDEGLTLVLNRSFGTGSSNVLKEYVGATQYKTLHEVTDLPLVFNTGEIRWYDNPPTITEQGKVVYCAIRKRINEVWSEFCVPAIWSSLAKDGTSETFAGTFYYMTVSPSIIKKSADNQFPGGNTISLNIFKSDNNVISKTYPNQGGNGTQLYQSINGGRWDEITSMSSSVSTYSYSVSDNVSNVAFKFVNEDGYELCTASVPVIVDGSILVGQDGYEVSIENDAWAIPCDSNNIITGLTYTNGVVETSPVSAYSGNTKLNITSIKINNVELTDDTNYSVNGCRLVINGKRVNGYYQEIHWVRVTGDTNSDSVYNVENAITKIPFTITFNGNDGNSVTRVKYINVYRINSGAPGVSPVVYKLNIHNDTISGTYSNDSYSWSESDFSGSIIRKIGDVTRTIENTAELNSEGLKLYAGTTLVSNGSASQFTYTGGQFTTKGAYGVAALFNANQAARGFTFYLKDSNNNVQDSEDVTYVLDGQKGDKGDTGSQGLQGCVIRTSLIDDGTSTTKYRNDENLATTDTRYIDIVGSSNPSATDGFDWYKVRPANGTARVITGVATMRSYIANYSSSSVYLEKLNDVGGIYASFILAKNAKIKFLTNNELTVVDSNNNPVAGITGGGNTYSQYDSSASNVRIWAGSGSWYGGSGSNVVNLSGAAFKVYEDGSLVATKADIAGSVTASNGSIYLGNESVAPSWITDVDNASLDVIAVKALGSTGYNHSFRVGGNTAQPEVANDFAYDGSGHIAGGSIYWNKNGDFVLGNDPLTSNDNGFKFDQEGVFIQSRGSGIINYVLSVLNYTGFNISARTSTNGPSDIFSIQIDAVTNGSSYLPYGKISTTGYSSSFNFSGVESNTPYSFTGATDRVQIGNVYLYFVNGLYIGNNTTGTWPIGSYSAKHWTDPGIWED